MTEADYSERRPMPARVTDGSRLGWRAFADAQGVSVNNLIEALGLELGELAEHRLTPFLARVVARARAIDNEHKRR